MFNPPTKVSPDRTDNQCENKAALKVPGAVAVTTKNGTALHNTVPVLPLKERVRQDILRRIAASAEDQATRTQGKHRATTKQNSIGNGQRTSNSQSNRSGVRKLIFSLIAVTVFLLTGATVLMVQEGWHFLDSVYFAIVTLTTIGFGDVVPVTSAGKLFVVCYILVGVAIISIALGVLGEALLDNLIALGDLDDDEDEQVEPNRRQSVSHNSENKHQPKMKRCLRPAAQRLAFALASVAIVDCIGVMFFMWSEDYSFVDALYLCTVSLTTVGYGDKSPKSPGSRAFSLLWLLIGTLLLARGIGVFVDFFVEGKKAELRQSIIRKPLTVYDLITADSDSSGSLSEAEFVLFKLQQLGVVNQEYLIEIADEFKRLDKNKDKKLTLGELAGSMQ